MAPGGEPTSEQNRREGRGRLSSIELLPEEATPAIVWASDQLRDRKRHSNAILDEFNKRLADLGIGKVSKSAWSRYAVRTAVAFRKLDERQRMTTEIVQKLGAEGADDSTVVAALTINDAILDKFEESKTLTPKDILELARSLSASAGARKTSADDKKRRDELLAKLDKVIEDAGQSSASPDAQAVLKRIREDVYGIFDR